MTAIVVPQSNPVVVVPTGLEGPEGPAGSSATTHASLTDIATSGHPASVISGLGDSATLDVGTTTGTVAAGDDDRFLPSDPGAPLAAMTGFAAASTVGNTFNVTIGAHTAPTMRGGLGHYVIQVAVDDQFNAVIWENSTRTLQSQFVVNAMAAPPIYARAKAVDYYGNESAWLVHGAVPPTPDPVTMKKIDSTGVALLVNTVAAAGSTETLDGDDYNIHDITLDESVTFTFTTGATVAQFTLILRQDGSGGNSVTWPASVKWHSLTAPTILTTASAVHVLEFLTVNSGTTWRGFLASSAAS